MRIDPIDRKDRALRQILAGWLLRREDCTPDQAVQEHGVDAVLAACEREGVVSLVHARLTEAGSGSPVPPELLQPLAARARACAARSLLCGSEARRIQQALDAAGIQAIWLKGIALGQWLYPSPHLRDIADIDLLLPDHATTLQAAEVLAPLGYSLPNPHIAGDLVVHELLAWSERAHLELDLHWDLSNDALFANRISWNRLFADAVALPALGAGARGLSPEHALLHASMHRALNHLTGRENRLRWLYDIHLLWEMLEVRQVDAVKLAVELLLADACLDALQASQATFDTIVAHELLDALQGAAARESLQVKRLRNWTYFQRATWRQLPGLGGRLRWLRQLMMPALAHLRARYGGDGAGVIRLMLRRLGDGARRWRAYQAKANDPDRAGAGNRGSVTMRRTGKQ